ncbi:MAG: Dabb family protein [Maribacter sp.]
MKKTIFTLLFLTFTMTSFGQTDTDNKSDTMREFDSAFAHTVYFWLANPDNQQDRGAFETSLQKFLDNSGYAKTSFIGVPPRASRDVVDGSFTYSLIVSFESAEAQQNYQDEAPHKLFIEESSKLWTKVIVYDSKGIN